MVLGAAPPDELLALLPPPPNIRLNIVRLVSGRRTHKLEGVF